MDNSLFVDAPHPDAQNDLFVDKPHPSTIQPYVDQPAPNKQFFNPQNPETQAREQIEPGVMGSTNPAGQEMIGNASTVMEPYGIATGIAAIPQTVRGLAGIAGKGIGLVPGLENAGTYLNRFAQNQMIKNIGGVRGQIHQLGPEKAREIADYMFQKGYGGPLTGSVGMEKNITNAAKRVGGELGAIREGVQEPHRVADLIGAIKSKLDPEILTGARAGEAGTYQNALAELQKLGETATPAQIAKTVTKLNAEAKNLNSLKMPSGSMADVARELRDINDAKIASSIGPKSAANYTSKLEEYRKLKPLEAMEQRGTEREMAGRGGPGLVHGGVNKLMDVIGHKALASGAKNVYNQIAAPLSQNLQSTAMGGMNLAAQTATPWGQQLEEYLRKQYGQ